MKFGTPKCPECGEYAKGTVEIIHGLASLIFDNDVAEYAGETDVWWNDQKTVRDKYDRVTLVCGNNHEWRSTMDPDGN